MEQQQADSSVRCVVPGVLMALSMPALLLMAPVRLVGNVAAVANEDQT